MPLTPYEQQLANRGLLRTNIALPGSMSDAQLRQARQPSGEADIEYNMALNGRNVDGSMASEHAGQAALAQLKAKRDQMKAAYADTAGDNRVTVVGNEEVDPETASMIAELRGQGLVPKGEVGLGQARQAVASNKRFRETQDSVIARHTLEQRQRDAQEFERYKVDAPVRMAQMQMDASDRAYDRGAPDRAMARDLTAAQIAATKGQIAKGERADVRAEAEYQSPQQKQDAQIYGALGDAAMHGNVAAIKKLREFRASHPGMPDPSAFDPGAGAVMQDKAIVAGIDEFKKALKGNNWALGYDDQKLLESKAKAMVEQAGPYGPEVARKLREAVDEVAGTLMWEPGGYEQMRGTLSSIAQLAGSERDLSEEDNRAMRIDPDRMRAR